MSHWQSTIKHMSLIRHPSFIFNKSSQYSRQFILWSKCWQRLLKTPVSAGRILLRFPMALRARRTSYCCRLWKTGKRTIQTLLLWFCGDGFCRAREQQRMRSSAEWLCVFQENDPGTAGPKPHCEFGSLSLRSRKLSVPGVSPGAGCRVERTDCV